MLKVEKFKVRKAKRSREQRSEVQLGPSYTLSSANSGRRERQWQKKQGEFGSPWAVLQSFGCNPSLMPHPVTAPDMPSFFCVRQLLPQTRESSQERPSESPELSPSPFFSSSAAQPTTLTFHTCFSRHTARSPPIWCRSGSPAGPLPRPYKKFGLMKPIIHPCIMP